MEAATSVAQLVGDDTAASLAAVGVMAIQDLVSMLRLWRDDTVNLILKEAKLTLFEGTHTKQAMSRKFRT